MQTLPKSVPESMFLITDFAVRTLAGFRKLLVYCESVSESRFVRLLAGFRKPDMTVNILSSSSVVTERVFTFITGLLKPSQRSLYWISLRICIISVFIEAVLKCMFKYLKNHEINKFISHK